MPQHLWITGGRRADRERCLARLPAALLPTLVPAVDAHRRLRGPYTAAGAIVRALVPGVIDRDPGLVRRYDIELLSAAPDLAPVVPSSRETLTSMAIPAERTRYYALLRTRRIANGLVEFVCGALATSSLAASRAPSSWRTSTRLTRPTLSSSPPRCAGSTRAGLPSSSAQRPGTWPTRRQRVNCARRHGSLT